MNIRDVLLPEFDQEMASTRKTLERVPEGSPDFKPHPKSMPLARLAGHVAELPLWGVTTLTQDSFDFAPPGGSQYQPAIMTSRAELLAKFDEGVAKTRAALAAASDEAWQRPWSLQSGGKTLFSAPKLAVWRGFVISHLIHHRAQLGVYLRLNNVPVPSIYGPSADESPF
ncbi:MAG TPA: DinB family protein [Candidatus Acidoferrales bacterium]|nr:DinB family protein [Candidatus Acidoferrales bacterium]